ncbi:Small ubiquitin- modifier 1 [Perkinsus olseni]|uniref:Small ubiquitin- modifier 1 n=1 Tax=Perkinsus olseni TaxID=32597 RepID=A0A7J6QKT8_PEROL|nr:Small ubiquitin- modifier 1 [Perkinsus olseni]KAF4654020.1 Small ubiquitin- modifier 1 [Perkinsus olseni]KAF4681853.1 Small ubiquitin- modifier 1 [Perkinsus olseni]KAF4708186.1 Small ubiquitin- modifier 1 [Perkinsus olseni]KAF4713422.1 Small ubiquitin- modifier 1 [Perkinsus olseni]
MSETPADNHNGEQEQQQENKDQDQPQSLQLKVKNAEGKEVMFKLKRGTPLRKLMDAYCTREGLPSDGVRFLYDGERINRDSTPQELDMQDQDEIDALVEQTGGCGLF